MRVHGQVLTPPSHVGAYTPHLTCACEYMGSGGIESYMRQNANGLPLVELEEALSDAASSKGPSWLGGTAGPHRLPRLHLKA